jgi:hypothetical protein
VAEQRLWVRLWVRLWTRRRLHAGRDYWTLVSGPFR